MNGREPSPGAAPARESADGEQRGRVRPESRAPRALDPRLGILWLSTTCVAVWAAETQSLSALAVALLFAMLIHRESPSRLIASMKTVLVVAGMAVLFNAFTWVDGLGPAADRAGLLRGLALAARFLMSVLAGRFLVVLQGETGIARGIAWWLRPLGNRAEERVLGFVLLVLRGIRDLRRANRLRADALRARAGSKPGLGIRAWSWQGLLRRHLIRTVRSADALFVRGLLPERGPTWPAIGLRDWLVLVLWGSVLALCLRFPAWL